ncbi:Gag-Pol polyprotein [Labeo rohita]|uniref:Gag-Pol polyprotein n=1 Tax=Labeo rohita TaxID=84645 RepID=A0ABQ8L4J7_LABRO|nr:Gag-Pol polyprotein [Labeo rohita]
MVIGRLCRWQTSVLLQYHGDRLRPVAYFSSKLDPAAVGLPLCLRAVAAAEQAVIASREFVGYSDLTLMAPHADTMILQEQKTSHLSTARSLRYHTILLDMPNITIKRCTTLNAATLLPTEGDGEEHHCCLTTLEQICTPRPDLSDMPLKNCDNVLFVDGSASKDPQTGQNKVGYAITTELWLPESYRQITQLRRLANCKLMKDQCVTIYTDSRYAFGVTHDFGALWKHKIFEIRQATDFECPLGNARADAAAKTALTPMKTVFHLYRACRPLLQGQKKNSGGSVAVK